MNTHETTNYITPTWICATLGCKPSTLDWWRAKKGAPAIILDTDGGGKRVYFERTAFLNWFSSYAEKKTQKPLAIKRRAMLHALKSALAALPVAEKPAQPALGTAETQAFISLPLGRGEVLSLTTALRDHLDFALDSALDDGVDPMHAARIRDIVRVLSRLHTACLHKANLMP